jgi:hypothetical protein
MSNITEPFESRRAARLPQQASALAAAAVAVGWLGALLFFAGPDLLPWLVGRLPQLLLPTLAVSLICLLPGLALLRWLWHGDPLAWPVRLPVAAGLGAGLPAVLLMLFHLLGLPWGAWQTAAYLALALAALLIRRPPSVPALGARAWSPSWADALLVGLTLAALVGRLFTIRDLLVGANADSFHHTMIAQLLVERGGIFSDWQPYAPLVTFTYHYGFHALVAFTHWVTGAPIPGLLPVVGQIMGAAIVPAIYALTVQLTRRPAAGIWAALLAGFVNTQPAYYVFWGRYPFVMSHVLLIAILCCWLHVLALPRLSWRPILLAGIASAALAHTHYQTTIFAALFIMALLAARLLRAAAMRDAGAIVARAALIGAVALVIAAPWLLNTIAGNLDRNVAFNSDRQSGAVFAGVALPPLLPLYLKGPILALALAGLLLAIRQRATDVLLLGIWALLSLLAALPYLVGLPGTGAIEPGLAPLILYLTAAPLAGYTLSALLTLEPRRTALARALLLGSAAAMALVSGWGVGWQRDLAPAYARMVTPADERAIAWLKANTPTSARFLVSSHPLYGGLMLVGTDAGWWLPLLAGRQVSVPPLSYGSELSSDPDLASRTDALAATLRGARLSDLRAKSIDLTGDDALAALRAAGITHIYIGAQPLVGAGTFESVDHVEVGQLLASGAFHQIYAADGVTIFSVDP